MASYTYPTAAPVGDLTPAQIQTLLGNQSVIARRVADITKLGFVGDYLLSQRLVANGGGVFYETGESAFSPEASAVVAPGSEYPNVLLPEGVIAGAAVQKRGLGTDITDEKIKQRGMAVVTGALTKLGNTVIRDVDQLAMAVVAAKVTSTFASPAGTWDTAGKIVRALEAARQNRADMGMGYDLSTVVLSPDDWAAVLEILVDKNAFPRENGNPVVTGNLPREAFGFTFVTTPYYTGNPLLIDRDQLGGMADESLDSPDWSSYGGSNVEAQRERGTGKDKWIVRARRVTVPIVLEPLAGVTITGTGL